MYGSMVAAQCRYVASDVATGCQSFLTIFPSGAFGVYAQRVVSCPVMHASLAEVRCPSCPYVTHPLVPHEGPPPEALLLELPPVEVPLELPPVALPLELPPV